MKARMKFLIETMGWETFRAALDDERERVGPIPLTDAGSAGIPAGNEREGRKSTLQIRDPRTSDPAFQTWVRDAVIEHKIEGFRGVHVRIKLGDLTSERARQLAKVVRQFSAAQLRVSVDQNIYLPWVREDELYDLYSALGELSLAEHGVGTIADVTTCPGSDTCRLGIASAKGLGSAISEGFNGPLAKYAELARPLRVKISGCPNGCAHHSIANIGFYAAALTHEERSVPAHFVTVGGQAQLDQAQFGALLGKFPAKNCVKVTETLLEVYESERQPTEDFNTFVSRTGLEHLKAILEPLKQVPAFAEDPTFYEDYGHEHERFAVRKGIKGECAGSTVAETLPTIEMAREWLAQAEALIYHKEYEQAVLAAYDAAAAAARVPLYQRLVDPFTAEEALWEFENLFVLSGETGGAWQNVSSQFDALKKQGLADVRHTLVCRAGAEGSAVGDKRQTEVYRTAEEAARTILNEAKDFVSYCAHPVVEEAVAFA
jgi:dissimilatory sulfite reductase (desulfoviridin) alpha/beta subunit